MAGREMAFLRAGHPPWFACDRGGWFGKGLPGRSFKTHQEAITYAAKMARFFSMF